jgi:broad specificity phosphatase PhoE
MNYKEFTEQIKSYKPTDKLAILIRHADRDKIPEGAFGNDILLNDIGKEHSIKFGKAISNLNINAIYSSPIPRCVQTSELILEGYGKSITIEQTKTLGDPGLHVTDEVLAGQSYLKYGFEEIYHKFMANNPIDGSPMPETFFKQMSDFITERTKENGITLFVTHDSLIAMYHYCLEERVYNTKTDWVNYLTGVIVKV